ncbi:MAG: ribonuclease P protein component [bacterium]|nr:ribonuclease P protein component [bacterium]
MKKINILKESREFNRIINSNRPYKYKDYIIYLEKDTKKIFKFGISVGKKIGNAVARNKIKRQIKSILDEKYYQNGFNCIIIVSKGINGKNFKEKRENLLVALNNLNIMKENDDEKQ